MPVEFLTDEQAARYRTVTRVIPTPEQLTQFLFPERGRAGPDFAAPSSRNNLLGFAVQLGTLRFLGSFLPNPGR